MTPEQAIDFKDKLPSGWLAQTQELLRAAGHSLSDGQVSKVKTGKSQNAVIEEVLFVVANREADRRAEVDRRIADLDPKR